MSSKKYEANGYDHDLDLIITLHQLCISYPYTRSGCIWRNIQITQVYLTYNQHEYKGGCRLGPNTKETLKSRLHSFCALQPYCRGVVGFLQGREAVQTQRKLGVLKDQKRVTQPKGQGFTCGYLGGLDNSIVYQVSNSPFFTFVHTRTPCEPPSSLLTPSLKLGKYICPSLRGALDWGPTKRAILLAKV